MLIVGELINSSRKAIKPAVIDKDAKLIQDLALKQVEAGTDYVDVNCGTQVFNEVETMQWLVEIIQQASDAPLCIDSPSEKALAAGLEAAKGNGKQQMINSITAESDRYHTIISLAQEYKPKLVALCMDDQGMPETADDRIRVIDKLINNLTKDGVKTEQIYLDPLVKPVSTGDKAGLEVLDTLRYIRQSYPGVHTICGLSNISFGLPNRKVLNRVFLIQTMTAGMDGYILDPLDKEMMGALHASRALLGQDEYCVNYLSAHRQGLYNKNQ